MNKGKLSPKIRINSNAQSVLDSIEELKKSGKNYWNIPLDVAAFIYHKIIETNAQNILEIGTSVGYSGIIMAEALAETGGHLYTLESHQLRFSQASENFKSAEVVDRITQILGHAPQAFTPDDQKPESMRRKSGALHPLNCFNPMFTGKQFDFAFFDATKKEHVAFFKEIQPYMAKGHLIITDNMLSHKDEMQPYYDYVCSLSNYKSTLLELGTGILVSQHLPSS